MNKLKTLLIVFMFCANFGFVFAQSAVQPELRQGMCVEALPKTDVEVNKLIDFYNSLNPQQKQLVNRTILLEAAESQMWSNEDVVTKGRLQGYNWKENVKKGQKGEGEKLRTETKIKRKLAEYESRCEDHNAQLWKDGVDQGAAPVEFPW